MFGTKSEFYLKILFFVEVLKYPIYKVKDLILQDFLASF